jgi:hypothetical protein
MDNALKAAHIGEAYAPDAGTDIGARVGFVAGIQVEHPRLTAIRAKVDAAHIARPISSCRPTNFRRQK